MEDTYDKKCKPVNDTNNVCLTRIRANILHVDGIE